MCGTAVEVTPIRSIDDHEIGPPGPITREIQQSYLDTVRGLRPQWADWLDYQTRTPAQA
jgi:branched-chain amino acid aminotransferase